MPLEINWTDTDPETGKRRYLSAEKFARVWEFSSKLQRRGDWTPGLIPTKEMLEFLLDAMQRRYQRREGVTEADVKQVQKMLQEWREPPEAG